MAITGKIGTGAAILRNLASTPKPNDLSHLTYAVNNFCNNRCVMCNIWTAYRDEPHLLAGELSAQQFRAALTASNYLRGLKHVLLTGGEPILKEDFVDIYLAICDFKKDVRIGIASNGRATALIGKRLRAIRRELDDRSLQARPVAIGFSLDGFGEMHDRVRGVPGLFECVMRSIEEVRGIPNATMALSFTIGPHNHRDFLKVYRLANELGVGFAYRCVQTSPIYYRNESAKVGWQPEQLHELRSALAAVERQRDELQPFLRKLVDMTAYYNTMMLEYERSPRRLFECYSGTHSVFIDSTGNVLPCIIRDGSFGNIRHATFDQVWESEAAQAVRRSIAAHECHCWVDCEVNPSLGRQPKAYLHNARRAIAGSGGGAGHS